MAKKKAKAAEVPFEAALEELHQIVERLDGGELPLEKSLDQFERGMTLLKQCHATLATAEKRVELLTGVGEDGSPQTAPFDTEATADRATADRGAPGRGGAASAGDLFS